MSRWHVANFFPGIFEFFGAIVAFEAHVMERRSNLLTYVALAWLGAFVLMAHAGISVPDGFRLAILVLTFWSLGYLYYRLCRRWPLAGFLGFGFIVGLFGGGYQSSATTVVEYDDGERIDHDCDGN